MKLVGARALLLVLAAFVVPAVLVPTPAAAFSFGTQGTRVATSDSEFVMTLSAPGAGEGPCIGSRDTGVTGDPKDDTWYIHFGPCGDTTVNQGNARDFRITGAADSGCTTTAMAWVSISDCDSGRAYAAALVAFPNGQLCWLDVDGIPGFTPTDFLYYDADASGGVSTNDVRMNTASGGGLTISAGTIVKLADTDVGIKAPAARTATSDPDRSHNPIDKAFAGSSGGCGGFTVAIFRARGVPSASNFDTIYLKGPTQPGGTTSYVVLGNLRMATANTGTSFGSSGQFITTVGTEAKRTLQYVAATGGGGSAMIVRDTPLPANMQDQNLYLHFADPDGVDDKVLQNDLVLKRSTGNGAGSPGTLVSSTSNGMFNTIDGGAVTSLEATVGYVNADGIAGYTPTDPVYWFRPAAMGGAGALPRTIAVGDMRMTSVTVGGTTYSAGSLVAAGDADLSAFNTAPYNGIAGFFLKLFDNDRSHRIPLTTLSNAKFHENGAANQKWDAGEPVYIAAGSAVTTGDTRLCCAGDVAGTANGFVSAGGTGIVTCPADPDCNSQVAAASRVKVTGSLTTWVSGRSQYIYWSDDNTVGLGDFRVVPPGALASGAATPVASGDADAQDINAAAPVMVSPLTTTQDELYLSFDAGCPAACVPFPRAGDVKMYPSFGTVLTQTSTETVPWLSVPPAAGLLRNNRGDATQVVDDAFYISWAPCAANTQCTGNLRLTASGTKAAGTFVASGDTTDFSGTLTTSASVFPALFQWIDNPGVIAGYTADDWVYTDLPPDVGGSAALGTLSAFDIREDKVTSGSTTYNPDTFVQAGDKDIQTTTAFTAQPTPPNFYLRYYDANRNGLVDSNDAVYLLYGDPATAPNVPFLNTIRLSGSGGASSSGGGGGGGGYVPPPTNYAQAASIGIDQPVSGAYVVTNSPVTISGTANGGKDSAGNAITVSSVGVAVNGAALNVTGTTSWSATFLPTGDGVYTITATVFPATGASAQATRLFNANAQGAAPGTTPPPTTTPSNNTDLLDQLVQLGVLLNTTQAQNAQLNGQLTNLSQQLGSQGQSLTSLQQQLTNAQTENARLKGELANATGAKPGTKAPGFEPLVVLAGLGVALVVQRRRRRP